MSAAKPNELTLTRIYNAPVKLVWDAWTDPAKVQEWWGPRGFTLTTHGKDLRAGGFWKYTMHGPDGTDYPNNTVYHEVEPFKKLVYDHGASDDRPPLFRVTVLFAEDKGKTTMRMTMALPTPEAAEETRKFIKKAGGDATWDRLAEYLEYEVSGRECFQISRSFDVARERMFDLWTDPKHVVNWAPPTGFTMQYISADIREGGSTHYSMGDGKMIMYGRASYIKIARPDMIVYTQQFCDRDGNISRHPLAPVWPETMLTTVILAEEGPNRTRVTVQWEPHGKVTDAELECFINARSGMTMGWTGSFDKLDAVIAEKQAA